MSSQPSFNPEPFAVSARPFKRRDNLPLWVIILLILFAGTRIYEVAGAPRIGTSHVGHGAAPKSAESGLDVAALQDLLSADLESKIAFVSTLSQPKNRVAPERTFLASALDGAEHLQKDSGNAPGAARRVLILRALLRQLPLPKKAPAIADPLAAFSIPPPTALSASDKAQYTAEAALWRAVLSKGRTTPAATAALARQIEHLPNIRWWRYPGLVVLYAGKGDPIKAAAMMQEAGYSCVTSLTVAVGVGLFRLALFLIGCGLLLYFIAVAAQNWRKASGANREKNLWITEPPPIADSERRLGAGDLMGVFVLYLVTREVVGYLLTGYSGFGAQHLGQFGGLLTPHLAAIRSLPLSRRNAIGVVLESVVYIITAIPPAWVLISMARRRGASLADEIGLKKRNLGPSLVYGLLGYSIALPIMLLVTKVAPQIFKHAPDPSNPVIPQLVYASGFWVPALLILLASLVAPLVEELFFRGVLYQAARLRLGVWPAIIVTGLVFGFVHPVGIEEMFAIAVLGSVFAWMAETRKSLLPSMLAHGLNNFTATVMLLMMLAG